MTSSLEVERPAVELRMGGERLAIGSGGVHQHIDPTTGRPDADVPLAGTVEVERAVQVAHAALETGEVLINGAANLGATRPFGGTGISGMGKEGGRAGLEEFLHVKTVSMA